MLNLYFAVTSIVAIAEAIVLPSGGEVARNSTSVDTPNFVTGTGVLQLPVAKNNNTKPTRKRQSLDGLRNDISGYSIQSEFAPANLKNASLIVYFAQSALEHLLRLWRSILILDHQSCGLILTAPMLGTRMVARRMDSMSRPARRPDNFLRKHSQ